MIRTKRHDAILGALRREVYTTLGGTANSHDIDDVVDAILDAVAKRLSALADRPQPLSNPVVK